MPRMIACFMHGSMLAMLLFTLTSCDSANTQIVDACDGALHDFHDDEQASMHARCYEDVYQAERHARRETAKRYGDVPAN